VTPKKEAFQLQARQAARAVNWLVRLLVWVPLGFLLVLTGLGLTQSSSLWIGIPTLALGVAVCCYVLWFAFVGRVRALLCPNCGTRGCITKREWDYYFHCPKCGRSASTGVGVAEDYVPPVG